MGKKKAKILGVFDSGLGGLTVLKEIINIKAYSKIIYLGDTGRVPYGTRSNDTIIKYARQDVSFLLSKGANEIIVACGTVSSIAIDILKKEFNVSIIGMIEFTIKEAINTTLNKKIGIIGTQATINNKTYEKKIIERDKDIKITSVPCPLFVPLVEYGFLKEKQVVNKVCEFYLDAIKVSGADTLIMGCTHYPILKDYFKSFMKEIKLIDMGISIVKNLKFDSLNIEKVEVTFYVTDSVESFIKGAELFFGVIDMDSVFKINDLSKY